MRINLIGGSGCGATTVGRSLASRLDLPYFDSDDFFHAPSDPPFQQPRDPDERFAMISNELSPTEHWVLAGGIVGWNPCPPLDFTCIVFLFVPVNIRIPRLRRREFERFGDRILEGGDMHQTHEDFIHWASRYDAGDVDGKTLSRHQDWLQKQTCPVLKIQGTLPVAAITEAVLRRL